MASPRLFRLTLTAISALVLAVSTSGLQAQEKQEKAPKSKVITKGSGKYEEHYELVPAEDDPAAPAAGGANLDPEGDAPSPAARPAPPSASYKSSAPPAPAANRKPIAEPPAASVQAPEPARIDSPSPAKAEPAARSEKRIDQAAEPVREPPNRKPASVASEKAAQDATGGVEAAFFYSALRDGGSWIDKPRYGKVFVPKAGDDWRPYTLGRWAYAEDYGWTWISDETFGWATYHYGRWASDADTGWFWVPGTDWAPSWVVWRQGEDAIGWAPLPPTAGFAGTRVSVDAQAIESEQFKRAWVFIDPRYFGQPGMRRYIRNTRWTDDLIARTVARVGYEREGERVANRGLSPSDIERLAGRPVQRITITLADDPRLKRPDTSRANAATLYQPGAKRMQEAARKGAKQSERSDELVKAPDQDSFKPRDDKRANTAVHTEGEEAPKHKSSSAKAQTSFAPQPTPQRAETESSVTEFWGTPAPAEAAPAKAADSKSAEGKAAAKGEAKFSPASSQRTETEGSVTESWTSPAPAANPPVTGAAVEKREHTKSKTSGGSETATSGKKASQAENVERAQGSRYESYTVPKPEETGDAVAPGAGPEPSSTGSVAKPKRRWDGSGGSGGPSMVPGTTP